MPACIYECYEIFRVVMFRVCIVVLAYIHFAWKIPLKFSATKCVDYLVHVRGEYMCSLRALYVYAH